VLGFAVAGARICRNEYVIGAHIYAPGGIFTCVIRACQRSSRTSSRHFGSRRGSELRQKRINGL
jgi:hypothetical protein